jgi:DNA-binding transcriptional ArsR family regulator
MEDLMSKPPGKTEGDQSTLGAIVAHPLRSRCLTRLAERTASPTELSDEFEENLGNVSYHVRKLWRAGVIEITDEQPVRGAMEHFYRAVVRPHLSDEEVAKLSVDERQSHALHGLALLAANATDSIDEKAFGKRSDYHISRVPVRVDEEGWQAMRDLYADMLERILEIEVECTERLGASGERGTPVIAFNTFFEMPERPTED